MLSSLRTTAAVSGALAVTMLAASLPVSAQGHQRDVTPTPPPTTSAPPATTATNATPPPPTTYAPPPAPAPTYAPAPTAAPYPAPAPTYSPYRSGYGSGAPLDEGPTVGVHLTANSGLAVLERNLGESSRSFRPVCTAPCDIRVPTYGEYRVTGRGRRPSSTFALSADSQIEANLGSSGAMWTGVGLTVTGSTFALVGVMCVGLGAAVAEPRSSSPGSGASGSAEGALNAIGGTFLVLGLITGGIGLYLWLANGSSVEVNGRHVARAETKPSPSWRLTPRGLEF